MSELYIYDDLDEFDDIFGDLDMTMLHSGEKHRVFVYGTLMSGMRNHHRLKDSGAELLDPNSRLAGDFKMASRVTSSGIVPIVITGNNYDPDGGGIIRGELYEVDNSTLIMLDQFEGHPDVYERKKYITNYKGIVTEVWMYEYVDVLNSFCVVPTMSAIHEMVEITENRKKTVSTYTWRGL
jgi:gamma-glutamylcyclotransferase (GGCT)/AIG2-like uncharacterized protein YtfP